MSGGRRGPRGPGLSGLCGSWTPTAGPAPPPGPGPPGRPVPGRRCAPRSPSGCGIPPVSPSRPGTGSRSGSGAPRAGPWGLSRPPGPSSGAGATGRSWWMMAWRRDPPAARLIKHCPSFRRGRAAPAPTRRQPRTSDHPPPTLPTPWEDPWEHHTTFTSITADVSTPNRYVVELHLVSDQHVSHRMGEPPKTYETSQGPILIQVLWKDGTGWTIEGVNPL